MEVNPLLILCRKTFKGPNSLRQYAVRLWSILLPLAMPSAFAGPVIYSQGTISSESDILNIGTPIVATDLGNGAPAITINGVAFGADTFAGLSGFVHGIGDFSTQFGSGTPLDTLLSQLDFQNLGLGSASLTLSGLTAGNDYLLQMLLCNELNTTAKSSRVTIQGQAYNIVNFGNNANYVRAWFTASSSSEVIQFGNGSASESDRMIINAFAVSTVPEPASATLLGLGFATLTLLRRRTA